MLPLSKKEFVSFWTQEELVGIYFCLLDSNFIFCHSCRCVFYALVIPFYMVIQPIGASDDLLRSVLKKPFSIWGRISRLQSHKSPMYGANKHLWRYCCHWQKHKQLKQKKNRKILIYETDGTNTTNLYRKWGCRCPFHENCVQCRILLDFISAALCMLGSFFLTEKWLSSHSKKHGPWHVSSSPSFCLLPSTSLSDRPIMPTLISGDGCNKVV